MTDSIIQHLLENKKHTANHRNSKKTTTFVFNKCSVTYLRKCPIIQHLVSDSGHSQKRLKESGTTHICKAMKYTDLHLSPHSVYLSKQRLYRLKWTVTDNQWCKYAASANDVIVTIRHNPLVQRALQHAFFIPLLTDFNGFWPLFRPFLYPDCISPSTGTESAR